MNIITDTLDEIRNMKYRKFILQGLNFGMIVCSALMIWKTLMVVTNTESPVVVVLSGSMEPSYYRGDILFLARREKVEAGDIIVYQLENEAIPIVHRVITVQQLPNKEYRILTKGDNNPVDDRGLYPKGQLWIKEEQVMGQIIGNAPYVGMLTIWLNDYPMLKWAVIGMMFLTVLVSKDPS